MDWIIFGLVVIWLAMVSWFDIRKSEIPHSAWVIIPIILAGTYRIWQGGWPLVLLTAFVVVVSERERISIQFQMDELGRIITWLPLLFLGAFYAVQLSPISALAIIGFWAAWELKWWGGADAVTAITLIIIWPTMNLLMSFLVINTIAMLVMMIGTWIKEKTFKTHHIPGLPLLLLTIIVFQISPIISQIKLL